RRGCAGRVRHARHRVGIRHADFAFQAVGIAKEQAEDRAEVGDELVACPPLDQPSAYFFEGIDRARLEPEVVDASALEHRYLSIRLGVAVDLEDIELGGVSDADEGEPDAVLFRDLPVHLRLEDVAVKGREALRVVGEDRDVVDTVQEHPRPSFGRPTVILGTPPYPARRTPNRSRLVPGWQSDQASS